MLGELGRGAFGCALKARRRRDGALVCIKVLDSASMGPAERRMVRGQAAGCATLEKLLLVEAIVAGKAGLSVRAGAALVCFCACTAHAGIQIAGHGLHAYRFVVARQWPGKIARL